MIPYPFPGYALGMYAVADPRTPDAFAFMASPVGQISDVSCLNFRYYLRSNLKVYISSYSSSKTVAHFQVDGGFDFHQAFIDVLPGKYQIIWEVQWDQSPVDVVRNYRAAVDAVRVFSWRCAELRKFIAVQGYLLQRLAKLTSGLWHM